MAGRVLRSRAASRVRLVATFHDPAEKILVPGRLPRDLDAAARPAGPRARERGRIVRHAAHAERRLAGSVAVGEHDLDARGPRGRDDARGTRKDRQGVEAAVPAVEEKESRRVRARVGERDLQPRPLVLGAQGDAPPAERLGSGRNDVSREPGPPGNRRRIASRRARRGEARGDDLGHAGAEARGAGPSRQVAKKRIRRRRRAPPPAPRPHARPPRPSEGGSREPRGRPRGPPAT